MRWRVRAAVLALAVGFVVWVDTLLDMTADWWPPPNHVSGPARHDEFVSKAAARDGFPKRGVVGYRDDLFGRDPAKHGEHNALRFLFQYTLSPLLLDKDGEHDKTLVLTGKGFHLERAKPEEGR